MAVELKMKSDLESYLEKLFPITRSISGEGNRETLKILQEIIPIDIHEYPSGQEVFDWTIPQEWNIQDAWIKDSNSRKIVDFAESNLHAMSYSDAIDKKMTFEELRPNLYLHDSIPEAIPYRTSYYHRNWGFCITQKQFNELEQSEGELHVHINSEFDEQGSMSVGELLIPGKSQKEILISSYICHPSLANDNLSGFLLTAFLARYLLEMEDLEHSWRIIFVPETIGAIAYCFYNRLVMKEVDCGLVVTTVGGPGQPGYKQSFDQDHFINRLVEDSFQETGHEFLTYPFDIHGSDERQYSSIGFRINTASITKDKYYEYPYYHSSLDNLDFVSADNILISYEVYTKLINKLDKNMTYKVVNPYCETMLSKHHLYPKDGGALVPGLNNMAELDIRLWLLWFCDGRHSLFDIADELNTNIETLYESAKILADKGILAVQ